MCRPLRSRKNITAGRVSPHGKPAPLFCFLHREPGGQPGAGALLSAIALDAGKVRMHQILYGVAVCCALVEIGVLLRIRGGDGARQEGKLLPELRRSLRELLQSRGFLGFLGAVGLLYLTWKLDGTIFYLAQVQYVGLSEFWLSVSTAGNAMGQIPHGGPVGEAQRENGLPLRPHLRRAGACALASVHHPAVCRAGRCAHGAAHCAPLLHGSGLHHDPAQRPAGSAPRRGGEKPHHGHRRLHDGHLAAQRLHAGGRRGNLHALGASEQSMAQTFAFIGAVRAVTLAVFIARWLRGRRTHAS